MNPTARGSKDYPLGDLPPDRFEMLVFLLARAEDPRILHIREHDHGLDARLPTPKGQTLRGWQAKRYTSGINWNQCQKSVRRALAFWRPLRITFGFSSTLSAKDQTDFETELIDEFPVLQLDWWDASEIHARIIGSEAGKRAAQWAFEDYEDAQEALRRALAVGGELSDAAQAAARAAEIQQFLRERDPHLSYTVLSRDEDAPETPPAIETVLSVETEVEGMRIRFDAAERYPGAVADLGLGGRLLFASGEAGRAARETLDRAVTEGGRVRLSSGVKADLDVPPGLRGLMPEGLVEAEVELRPGVDPPIEGSEAPGFPTLVRCGDAELGLVLVPGKPPEGWDVAAVGAAGGFEMWLAWRGPEGQRESSMGWRWNLGQGTAREQLMAAQVMLAAHQSSVVELVDPRLEEVVAGGTFDSPEDVAEAITDLEAIVDFLAAVAEVETWIGVPLEPPAEPSEADLKVLEFLIPRIRSPDYTGAWTEIKVSLSRSLPKGGQGEWAFAFFQPFRATLFGEEYYLGAERGHITRGQIDGATGEESPGDEVKIVPIERPGEVDLQFLSPLELPEEAAAGKPDPPETSSSRG